jgi:hypothetical protein
MCGLKGWKIYKMHLKVRCRVKAEPALKIGMILSLNKNYYKYFLSLILNKKS